ncbi:MAG TPA: EamA family transporter RarD [Polyangiaceae bacterium]
MTERRRGVLLALAAYGFWGAFPIYLRSLPPLSPLELVSHRIVWSLAILLSLFLLRRDGWGWLFELRNAKTRRSLLTSSVLIAINWLVYVWAVSVGRVIECSLGYFINPLVSIGLGVFVLGERLRPLQWGAVAMASAAILWLTLAMGMVPWVALALALSFGGYGLVKKQAPVGGERGLALETLLLGPLALAVVVYSEWHGVGHFSAANLGGKLLIVSTGLATTLPLLAFSGAARRIPLSQIGFLQYLAPTLQFLIGLFVFHEAFGAARFAGFLMIWIALGCLALEGIWNHVRSARNPSPLASRPRGTSAP